MNVLLTGSTGYVGSAVLEALVAHGHDVLALTRSDASAEQARAGGATAVVGDLGDTAWLTARLGEVDAAIHLAAADDGTSAQLDDGVIDAVVAAFSGTGKPYLHTSGIWIWGSGADLTEDSPLDPPAIVAWRAAREERLMSSGVRATVVAPAIVYGRKGGIPAGVVAAGPRDGDGALLLVGDGTQHWTTVHVDDLAELYVLALERGPAGERLIAASGQNPTAREVAEAAAGVVVAESVDATRARLGEGFADALLLDQQASGAKARALGWRPSRPSLLDELAGA
ncbi:NAD-dependent epimerase/dehydratase family protein [Cellulomonas sp. PhB150]|uniref:NAD-dependent epimerase/dehydratase family protein n=1 Tax=Cellulomonas sp. PhB150 TaxID=2485188 RepID=UPI000F47DA22|nr:NAD-dependent epimerase/dehydratase family protein [Cellulomonas sp. PhB150]ROS31082.1 nucleoside-diphosphate-sugar epimerase [Cellulomonas sp. PhB150]